MSTKNISTNSLQGLVPVELTQEIIKDVAEQSVALQLAEVVPMDQPIKEFAVELETPGAYWVGEGEKITVDEASWKTIQLTAKKLAVIVPATREALEDGAISVIEEVKEKIAEAIAKELDKTVLFESGTQFGEGNSVFEKATGINNKLTATGKIFEDASNLMGLIEANDLDVNGFVAPRTLRAAIRNDLTAANNYVVEDKVNGEPARMHGEAVVYSKGFDKKKALMIGGDFSKVYVGLLDELQYSISTEGTVGTINLFEQDMVAIRATMRVGFLVIKDEAFAVLEPKATRSK